MESIQFTVHFDAKDKAEREWLKQMMNSHMKNIVAAFNQRSKKNSAELHINE